jgi:hypothetical protein
MHKLHLVIKYWFDCSEQELHTHISIRASSSFLVATKQSSLNALKTASPCNRAFFSRILGIQLVNARDIESLCLDPHEV